MTSRIQTLRQYLAERRHGLAQLVFQSDVFALLVNEIIDEQTYFEQVYFQGPSIDWDDHELWVGKIKMFIAQFETEIHELKQSYSVIGELCIRKKLPAGDPCWIGRHIGHYADG
jgi:hypothetical protein